jgi:pimeloyl-ACP methyl ester carboxylesterase
MRALHLRLALLLLALVAAACASGSTGAGSSRSRAAPEPTTALSSGPTTAPTAAPSSEAPPAEQELIAASEPVRFRSSDGVPLAGRVFGHGDVGVVLTHMLNSDQEPWWWMASILADHGFTALTYDVRGTCPGGPAGCSGGSIDSGATDRDILGAVAFLRDRGAKTVIAGGASMGAIASLWVASKHPDAVDGVFSLSAVTYLPPFDLTAPVIHAIRAPKLFVAGENDGSAAPYVAGWEQASTPPVRAVVLPTSTHGTDFFDDPEFSGRVRAEILEFVESVPAG